MTFNFEIQSRAAAELNHALDDYLGKSPELGASFKSAVNKALNFLLETPFGCAIWQGSVRRINIKGFPYALLYAIELRDPDVAHVVIISCIHQHSDPRRWPTRPE